MTSPADWHPDPSDPTHERWWDGTQWTDHTRPLGFPGSDQPTQIFGAPTPTPASTGESKKRPKWPWIAGAAIAAVVGIAACSGGDKSDEPVTPMVATSTTTAAPTTTRTTTATTTRPTTTTPAPTTTVAAAVPTTRQVAPTTTVAPAPVYTTPAPVYTPPPAYTPPAPVYTPPPAYTPPAPAQAPASVYYKNCDAARAAGAAPIYAGEPGYASKLDRDNDGVACE
ncbi:excalibur calcium-binding domain-containing protein [Rhodococcus rhodochrous]|uniref:Excalibur calcium-binding domain-containing protein n=1 Tax=Rhodococcus rhodochrous KG-21 TaxID=1441923 RepID=A0A0M9WNB8_RHORH|nr:excalibur calcium-binding domain-containing protein [Rhodococcus rhodochrous]KOS55423.1 hypothetical protein Z051_15095 [Rhodococcus rhodochrous KG-21]